MVLDPILSRLDFLGLYTKLVRPLHLDLFKSVGYDWSDLAALKRHVDLPLLSALERLVINRPHAIIQPNTLRSMLELLCVNHITVVEVYITSAASGPSGSPAATLPI